MNNSDIIIYNTADGKSTVSLLTKDGTAWMSQARIAELFATSKQNISLHIQNIFEEGELEQNSVVKEYLTTATDGKNYSVAHYSLEMILAIGFRVRSKRGTQFRQWANKNLREDELDSLNRFVVVFLETAELRAKNRQDIRMDFWRENIDRIIEFNDKELLKGHGSISIDGNR